MEHIIKTDNSNIPSSILVKGVSYDDFNKLFKELNKSIVDEGINKIKNYDKVIATVNKSNPDEEWKERLVNQVEESSKIIQDEYDKIEELFNRIFKDWEDYQEEHASVLEDVVEYDQELEETGEDDE